jgi:hypothetical protein
MSRWLGFARVAVAGVGLWACAGVTASDPLRGVHPYVWPHQGRIDLLLCRWGTREPIPVALRGMADEAELQRAQRVLDALQGAAPGVRLVRVEDATAGILVEFVEGPLTREGGGDGAGRTACDCRVGPGGSASLERAVVTVARQMGPDWRGDLRALSPEEQAGSLAHELGHALGFQGHARAPGGRSLETARRSGERILRGEPLHSAALRALYRQPSGAIRKRAAVAGWRTEEVDLMAALGRREALTGPLLRVGDHSARVFWRHGEDNEYGFLIPDLAGWIDDPAQALPIPEPRTRSILAAGRSDASPQPSPDPRGTLDPPQ